MPTLLILALLSGVGRGRPVVTPPPTASLSCWGDSIFAGACGQSPCVPLRATLGTTGWMQSTHAIAGETADQIARRIMAEAPTACYGGPCSYYEVNGVVNTLKLADFVLTDDATVVDVALNGDRGSDGVNDLGMLDAVDWIHGNYPHAKVTLWGVLPFAGCDSATCPVLVAPGARARLYNEAMLAACASRPWLACIDRYSAFEDSGNPDHLDPAIACSDGIHLLPGGASRIATYLYAAHPFP
jgi:hypothetical protein